MAKSTVWYIVKTVNAQQCQKVWKTIEDNSGGLSQDPFLGEEKTLRVKRHHHNCYYRGFTSRFKPQVMFKNRKVTLDFVRPPSYRFSFAALCFAIGDGTDRSIKMNSELYLVAHCRWITTLNLLRKKPRTFWIRNGKKRNGILFRGQVIHMFSTQQSNFSVP